MYATYILKSYALTEIDLCLSFFFLSFFFFFLYNVFYEVNLGIYFIET